MTADHCLLTPRGRAAGASTYCMLHGGCVLLLHTLPPSTVGGGDTAAAQRSAALPFFAAIPKSVDLGSWEILEVGPKHSPSLGLATQTGGSAQGGLGLQRAKQTSRGQTGTGPRIAGFDGQRQGGFLGNPTGRPAAVVSALAREGERLREKRDAQPGSNCFRWFV